MMSIDFVVTDVDGDGGYAFVRYRVLGDVAWNRATISSQLTPAGITVAPANFQITPGNNSFVWDYVVDGLTSGQVVEIELLPCAAVLGTPQLFTAGIP